MHSLSSSLVHSLSSSLVQRLPPLDQPAAATGAMALGVLWPADGLAPCYGLLWPAMTFCNGLLWPIS
jgi:hypothetical protein